MKNIKEILRLRFDCRFSYAQISASVNSPLSSVGDCVRRFQATKLEWQDACKLKESELESVMYTLSSSESPSKPQPDWSYIHKELRRKSVTKQLLWGEYKSSNPDGYQYTQFCKLYNTWKKTCDLVFRNSYHAGEKVIVDYAGQTVTIHDPASGQAYKAQIFIGVLGASNYTYAEATKSQTSHDWISSHKRMFSFFGGVPEIIIPDNLKSGVTKACRYDPVINRSYYEMARHYRTSIIPARARKPRDKAKAEQGVLLVERWILAALRNRKFFSLDELNAAILELLHKLNKKPFKKLDGTRESLFLDLDKPALLPLPRLPYEVCDFKEAKVNINYHIEINRHNYSVPYHYVGKKVEGRITSNMIEIICDGQVIASHRRSAKVGGYSTLKEHMPEKHKAHIKWTPERMIAWVGKAGPSTTRVAKLILESRDHPQQNFTRILGMIRLGEKYGQTRLEQASFCALRQNTTDYRSIKNILVSGRDQHINSPRQDDPIKHENIRGPDYYR